jgi:lysylphosphatidylglycerol synthetase-like protein (DUF2156 family)
MLHFVYEHIDTFYNFKGLHEFKNKFHPEWSPRYLIYPNAASLPAVWIAVVQANSGTSDLAELILSRTHRKGLIQSSLAGRPAAQ